MAPHAQTHCGIDKFLLRSTAACKDHRFTFEDIASYVQYGRILQLLFSICIHHHSRSIEGVWGLLQWQIDWMFESARALVMVPTMLAPKTDRKVFATVLTTAPADGPALGVCDGT